MVCVYLLELVSCAGERRVVCKHQISAERAQLESTPIKATCATAIHFHTNFQPMRTFPKRIKQRNREGVLLQLRRIQLFSSEEEFNCAGFSVDDEV